MKSFKFKRIYDSWIDVLDLIIGTDSHHNIIVEINQGIYLDFDKKGNIYAIELVGASQILDMKKEHIPNANMEILIDISSESIKFEITRSFVISKKKYSFHVEWIVSNDYGISQEIYELSGN